MIQKAATTGMFYLLAAATIYFLEKAGPSGPCTPGLGMLVLMLMLMPIVIVVLLSINLFQLYKGDRSSAVSITMHLAAVGIFCLQ